MSFPARIHRPNPEAATVFVGNMLPDTPFEASGKLSPLGGALDPVTLERFRALIGKGFRFHYIPYAAMAWDKGEQPTGRLIHLWYDHPTQGKSQRMIRDHRAMSLPKYITQLINQAWEA